MSTAPLRATPGPVVTAPAGPAGGRRVPPPPKDAARHAVDLLASRPHLTSAKRPPLKCCKTCRNAPPYNPNAHLQVAGSIAEGLDMAVRWNA